MLKEEASYYKEQEQQAVRIAKLEKETGEEDEPGNREFQLKQERQALEETKKVIPILRERITSMREKLESYLVRLFLFCRTVDNHCAPCEEGARWLM